MNKVMLPPLPEPFRTPLPAGTFTKLLAVMDEYATAHAAAVSAHDNAALRAEVAGLRAHIAKIVLTRETYGWSPEVDDAIDAALAAQKGTT